MAKLGMHHPSTKKTDAKRVTNFRPINLVHSIAKIFSKLLANRLAPRLNSLVSNCQSAFIKKRSIHDNFLYVQGAVQRLHTQKIPALFMKLDIHKLLIRFIGGTCSRFCKPWASDSDGVNGSLSFYVHPLPHPCLMGGRAPLLAMPEAFGKEIHSHPCYSSLLWTRFNVCLTGQPTMGYSPPYQSRLQNGEPPCMRMMLPFSSAPPKTMLKPSKPSYTLLAHSQDSILTYQRARCTRSAAQTLI